MVATLPEDISQISVETLQALLHILAVLAVYQVEDDVAGTVCIRPFLHFKRKLKLSLAQFKKLCGALIILERNWIGNVIILRNQLAWLAALYYVLVVGMQCIRDFSELFLAFVLRTKVEKLGRRLVIQVNQSWVLAEGIKDYLIRLKEEVKSWQEPVSLNQLI